MHLHPRSLSATVDAVNAAFFFGEKLSIAERREIAQWIAARQALPGAYGQLFAGFESERAKGIAVFTGERITSASARHILGEEACRALLLLDSKDRGARTALQRATDWLSARLEQASRDAPRNTLGAYCCGKCTVGLWRHIVAGGLDRQPQRLTLGVSKLHAARDGDGEWRTFPFWYTVLALSEMDRPDARDELTYASARITAEAQRPAGTTPHARRRNALAQRVLERMSVNRTSAPRRVSSPQSPAK